MSTLYSNCPKQRERVHFPINLSYWMNPPAFSILSRSSPLLCIKKGVLEDDRDWVGRGLHFWKCSPCSHLERRRMLCSQSLVERDQLLHKSEQDQDISGRTRSQVRRNSCSWEFWSSRWDRQPHPTRESSLLLFQWCCLWCTPCTQDLHDHRRQRKER